MTIDVSCRTLWRQFSKSSWAADESMLTFWAKRRQARERLRRRVMYSWTPPGEKREEIASSVLLWVDEEEEEVEEEAEEDEEGRIC
jgi:hypothetical protein